MCTRSTRRSSPATRSGSTRRKKETPATSLCRRMATNSNETYHLWVSDSGGRGCFGCRLLREVGWHFGAAERQSRRSEERRPFPDAASGRGSGYGDRGSEARCSVGDREWARRGIEGNVRGQRAWREAGSAVLARCHGRRAGGDGGYEDEPGSALEDSREA